MKKSLLIGLVLCTVNFAFAQIPMLSKQMLNEYDKVELKTQTNGHPEFFNNVNYNTRGAAYAPNETLIGTSLFDYQSNRSLNNRIYRYEDGRMSVVYTMGNQSSQFPDRVTGYNFFNGTE
jgi:hypothetical protein